MSLHSDLDTLYRQVIMDHYKNPRNRGDVDGETVTVNMNNPTCGDRIQLQMSVENDKIEEAKFVGEGCSISLASASMMTEIVRGRPVEEAVEIAEIFSNMMQGADYEDEKYDLGDVEALQGVTKFPARIKCATLAWKAMEQGLGADNSDGEDEDDDD
ncbi:nitrogen fixation NifU-like protein [Salsuginibacillus halophilus]|uniref:Nitrogen fixation NifU-like protein n=1 Tax=Salsuginibacillus halophilus TaxID=517424 RepID=A0A2P8HDY6_9BACI|nr:SUF system NifU family Fe-S cluster assembly protein [Salsuginibacillus halophilus]PSL44433.1 nitrogen fixation NifU-like protein [Salsuginibacillus halophilus]